MVCGISVSNLSTTVYNGICKNHLPNLNHNTSVCTVCNFKFEYHGLKELYVASYHACT